jgi:hypothetical protein
MDMDAPDDAALLARLDDLLTRLEPGEGPAIELGEAAYDWRTLDAELAHLTADSAMLAPAGIRSGEQPRLATFTSASLSVELEIETVDSLCRIVGQIVPPSSGEVDVRPARGEVRSEPIDANGGFVVERVPRGPLVLVVRAASGTLLETTWLLI